MMHVDGRRCQVQVSLFRDTTKNNLACTLPSPFPLIGGWDADLERAVGVLCPISGLRFFLLLFPVETYMQLRPSLKIRSFSRRVIY